VKAAKWRYEERTWKRSGILNFFSEISGKGVDMARTSSILHGARGEERLIAGLSIP